MCGWFPFETDGGEKGWGRSSQRAMDMVAFLPSARNLCFSTTRALRSVWQPAGQRPSLTEGAHAALASQGWSTGTAASCAKLYQCKGQPCCAVNCKRRLRRPWLQMPAAPHRPACAGQRQACCRLAAPWPGRAPNAASRWPERATSAGDFLYKADMAQAVVASAARPMGGRYTTRRSAQSAQRLPGTGMGDPQHGLW